MPELGAMRRDNLLTQQDRPQRVAATGLPRPAMSRRGDGHLLVASTLDQLVEEIADLRPLPPVAAQVLQIAEGEHFSAHELAQAISSDPALTARVLRAANSAYYGFPRHITTVRDAVVLLGFRQVRSVALAACAVGAMPVRETIDTRLFWRHAVTVALLAQSMARADHGAQEEEAFTAGVLHNIGRLALDQARPDQFREAVMLSRANRISLHEAEQEIFGFTDAEVGGALALRWQFPADLALAIAHHAETMDSLCPSQTLARLVIQARQFVEERGITDGSDAAANRPLTSDPAAVGAAGELATGSTTPPFLMSLLEQDGGFEALVGRASAFVEQTATGP
jgi:HD-like signal output (HDOD) protein